MTQKVNYSNTTPAADANNQLLAWKADAPSTDPAVVRQIAVEVPLMVASGASHQGGLTPDPGAAAGSTKFLREDATWQVPSGGLGSAVVVAASCVITKAALPATVNLTTEGTQDWLIPNSTALPPDTQSNPQGGVRKSGGGMQIAGFRVVGSSAFTGTTNFPTTTFNWSAGDRGEVTTSGSSTTNNAVFITGTAGAAEGLIFQVPCDTYARVLRIYTSSDPGYIIKAVSTDGSVNVSSAVNPGDTNFQFVTITYNGSRDGASLIVTIIRNASSGSNNIGQGAITLALAGGIPAGIGSIAPTQAASPATLNLSTQGTTDWFTMNGVVQNPPRASALTGNVHSKSLGGWIKDTFDFFSAAATGSGVAAGVGGSSSIAMTTSASDSTTAPIAGTTPNSITVGLNAGATINFGYRFRVPADLVSRTLKLNAAVNGVKATITFRMKDGSIADQTITLDAVADNLYVQKEITVVYNAGSPNSEMIVEVRVTTNYSTSTHTAAVYFISATLA